MHALGAFNLFQSMLLHQRVFGATRLSPVRMARVRVRVRVRHGSQSQIAVVVVRVRVPSGGALHSRSQ